MFCRSSGCLKIILILGNLYELTHATVEVSINRTWHQAVRHCLLIGSNNTGDVQKEKIKIPRTLTDGLYWIGAKVKQTAWFEILGNYSLNPDGVNGTHLNNSVHVIYDCYFICIDSENLKVFALMEKMCYCFSAVPSDDLDSSLHKVLHYEVRPRNPSKIKGSIKGDCVAFTKTDTEEFHEVLDCKTSLHPLCLSGVGQTNSSWSLAVSSCGDGVKSNFFAQYQNIPEGGPRWTGIARKSIRQWANGSKDMPLFGCLAVELLASKILLQEVLCDTKLPSLCIKGTVKEISESNKALNASMILAISLTATFVFLALSIFVCVALWKKKRNKTKSRITHMSSMHNQNYEVEMEGKNIQPLYDEVDKNNIYNACDTQNGKAEDTYDHTNIQSMGRILVVPADVYDSVTNVTSDKNYDILHAT